MSMLADRLTLNAADVTVRDPTAEELALIPGPTLAPESRKALPDVELDGLTPELTDATDDECMRCGAEVDNVMHARFSNGIVLCLDCLAAVYDHPGVKDATIDNRIEQSFRDRGVDAELAAWFGKDWAPFDAARAANDEAYRKKLSEPVAKQLRDMPKIEAAAKAAGVLRDSAHAIQAQGWILPSGKAIDLTDDGGHAATPDVFPGVHWPERYNDPYTAPQVAGWVRVSNMGWSPDRFTAYDVRNQGLDAANTKLIEDALNQRVRSGEPLTGRAEIHYAGGYHAGSQFVLQSYVDNGNNLTRTLDRLNAPTAHGELERALAAGKDWTEFDAQRAASHGYSSVPPEPAYPKTGDPRDAAHDRYYADKLRWNMGVSTGLSLGKITPQEAHDAGYYLGNPGEHGGEGHPTGTLWEKMPDTMYHATTALDKVQEEGLKTRDELVQSHGGLGLGGGASDTISFTADKATAENIAATMREYHDVLNGKITAADIIENAKTGSDASKPYYKELVKWFGPERLKLALEGRQYVNASTMKPMTAAEMPKGAVPDEQRKIEYADKPTRYFGYTQPVDKARGLEDAAALYFHALYGREAAGGRENPLFFGSDTAGLARVPKDQIGVVAVHPVKGARGYRMAGLGEWRTHTGRAVKVEGQRKDWTDFDAQRAARAQGKWKPVMTPAEGHAWAKDSKYPKTLVHLTSGPAVDGIEGTGFHMKSSKHEQGAYFATDRPTAAVYDYKGNVAVAAVVNIQKPLQVDFGAHPKSTVDLRMQALTAAYPDAEGKQLAALSRASQSAKATTDRIKAAGFDSVIIKAPPLPRSGTVAMGTWVRIGGNQVVVLDRRQVVIIGVEPISTGGAGFAANMKLREQAVTRAFRKAADETDTKDWSAFDAARAARHTATAPHSAAMRSSIGRYMRTATRSALIASFMRNPVFSSVERTSTEGLLESVREVTGTGKPITRLAATQKADALLKSPYGHPDVAARLKDYVATELAVRTELPYASINKLLYSWADSAQSSGAKSMQRAAATLASGRSPKGDAGKLLVAMHDMTQELLRSAPAMITLHRGLEFKGTRAVFASDTLKITSNALSSWSSDRKVAQQFAAMNEKHGVVLAAQIPKERIVALPTSGIGSYSESEVVVLGGRPDTAVVTWRQ